jgi:DNA-binding transcriptional MocR family regulator
MTDEPRSPAAEEPRFRYEEIAELITGLVAEGTLAPGTRAPSLRELCRQQRTSLTTALQAYRLLEDRGVLQARPQSGFYVAPARAALPVPATTRPPARPSAVAVSHLMLQMVEHASDPRYVPLGCAIPSPALLGSGKLDRMLARLARTRGEQLNTYGPLRGEAALRTEIARRALRWGQALAPDDIAITCGATEALALALSAVARPGDTVAVESPTYFGLLQVLRTQGLKALELPTDARSGIVVEALEKALQTQRIAAVVLSSCFNNPMGCTMPEAAKRAVLALLAKHRVPLIEDDVYGDIHAGAERPRPFSAFDRAGNVIHCGSFSKTLAPGYRIGWVATRRHLPRILEAKFAGTLCGPVLPQLALAEFLASGGYEHHLRRLRAAFSDTLRRMAVVIEASFPAGTRVSQPAGGFVLWLELPKAVDTGLLFTQALDKRICFAPGMVFSASGRHAHCMRLSGGHGWDVRLEKGLRTLGALAAALARHAPVQNAAQRGTP